MGKVTPVLKCQKQEIKNSDYDTLIKQDPTGTLLNQRMNEQVAIECYGFRVNECPEGEIAIIGHFDELTDYAASADVAADIIKRKIDNPTTSDEARQELSERTKVLTLIAKGLRQSMEYYAHLKQQKQQS